MDDWGMQKIILCIIENFFYSFSLLHTFLETIADDPKLLVIPPKSINVNKWEGEDEEEDVKVCKLS